MKSASQSLHIGFVSVYTRELLREGINNFWPRVNPVSMTNERNLGGKVGKDGSYQGTLGPM